ncbi:MAG: hypothetical protein ABIQ73_10015 [Acidimicrobiales bacterium]
MAKLRRGALAVGIVVALFGGGNSPVAAASDPVIAPAAAPLAPAAIGEPSTLVAVAPARIADTRSAIGGMQGPVAGDTTIDIQVIGAGGVPDGATSVVLNVTAVDPQTGASSPCSRRAPPGPTHPTSTSWRARPSPTW